jgi:peptide/nickel transport system permease protein
VLKYVLLRLAQSVPTLIAITLAGFLLIHLVPGDPARIILGPRATERSVAALRHSYGLDASLTTQYARFLRGAVHLDFGQSFSNHSSVASVILARLGPSAMLIGYSMVIALALAVPLAVLAAVKQDHAPDHVIRVIGMAVFAMPPFWLGLVLVLTFGLELGLLPTSGYGDGFAGHVRSLTLPALTTGLVAAPWFLRSLRASTIEALRSGYVEAARARGLSERRVLSRHVLRIALLPTVTVVGLSVGYLVSANVVVENVFGIPGLGSLMVSAVGSRDFPLIQGLVVILGVAVVLVNLATDLAYALIDPRVRL